MKEKAIAKVISQAEIAANIFDMWIETGLAKEAHQGQFIGVFPKNKSTILPRPISICEVNEDKTALRIVYRIAGQGTKEFSLHPSVREQQPQTGRGSAAGGHRPPDRWFRCGCAGNRPGRPAPLPGGWHRR